MPKAAGPAVQDPVNCIEWRDAATLRANAWNPNRVFNQELNLLELSILNQGWIQPVLINRDGLVIDGFHRWRLSLESKKLQERYHGMVPVAVLDVDDAQAMLITIRINRAKGTHQAVDMARVVHALIDEHGVSRETIMAEMGASRSEVDLLYQDSVFTAKNIRDYRYGKAWVPNLNGHVNAPADMEKEPEE